MNKAKYAKLEENSNDFEALEQPCAVVKCDKAAQWPMGRKDQALERSAQLEILRRPY